MARARRTGLDVTVCTGQVVSVRATRSDVLPVVLVRTCQVGLGKKSLLFSWLKVKHYLLCLLFSPDSPVDGTVS